MSDRSVPIPEDVLACPPDSFATAAWVKLRRFAFYMAARFNAPVYLVGSALRKAHPRDIDVRVTVTEEHFRARYGCDSKDWLVEGPSQRWVDDMAHFSDQLAREQRLNVDFQVYPARHAIQYRGQPRVLLAAPTGMRDPAEVLHEADLALADEAEAKSKVHETVAAFVEAVRAAQPPRRGLIPGGVLPDAVVLQGDPR
ncbi:MAG TPA: hypothetical protein VFN76_10055 [Candidatus Limnocylindria bacterium]|nr:hypothetical protein [Candidatus Limnocylindria bacterium]